MDHKTGEFIARRRKELGLTQRELAEQLGVTNKAVSKWETGQGMPDVGMLLELSRVLQVSVDEILEGEETVREEKQNPPETGTATETESPKIEKDIHEERLLDIAVDRAERKLAGLHIGLPEIAGGGFFLLAFLLIFIQLWYLLKGRGQGYVYLTVWIPCVLTGMTVLLLWLAGICIKRTRPICLKPVVMIAAVALFAGGIAADAVFFSSGKELLSMSPDFSQVMCLKIEENGRAGFYRQRAVIFAARADVLPFTVKDEVKVQWLEEDVCALTYESTDDGKTHQYVAAYGDRNEGVSYYYVFNAAQGEWSAEGNYGSCSVEIQTGAHAGIRVNTPEGTEYYSVEECLQYGTIAMVFPNNGPRWTLVLNKDCVIEPGESTVAEGGTLTLCRVEMDRTAPLILHKEQQEE